jgi:glycosyltransferase involved in cell wall biosynthesis
MNIPVSIIIPVFNSEHNILEKSLASIRLQTFSYFEVIVIDDSDDIQCAEFCKKLCSIDPRFKYFHPLERLGLVSSLNFGIEVAEGNYIARFDSDDICDPRRIELQYNYLNENPNVGVLGAWLTVVSNDGEFIAIRKYPVDNHNIRIRMHYTNAIAHPAVMFKKCLVKKFGFYNTKFKAAEDLELWLRWMNNGVVFHNLELPLVNYLQGNVNRNFNNTISTFKARIKNFTITYWYHRIFGLLLYFLWSIMPFKLRKFIYHINIYSNNKVRTQ